MDSASFLIIPPLTPKAQRQNVVVIQTQQRCCGGFAETYDSYPLIFSTLQPIPYSLPTCRSVAKNGSAAGSFCNRSSFLLIRLNITGENFPGKELKQHIRKRDRWQRRSLASTQHEPGRIRQSKLNLGSSAFHTQSDSHMAVCVV